MTAQSSRLPILVSLAGILAILCLRSQTAIKDIPSKPFDPSRTDVFGYSEGLQFAEEDPNDPKAPGIYLTLTWWKVLQVFLRIQEFKRDETPSGPRTEERVTPIDILDARQHLTNPSLDTNGFVLLNLTDGGYEPENWDDQTQADRFHNQVVVPKLKTLYPRATRFEVVKRLIRGRPFGPPPVTGGIHTDFSVDMEENDRYLEEYGENHIDGKHPMVNAIRQASIYHSNASSYKETQDDVLEAILTLWKPIERSTPVCDKPMMFMDASTYPEHDERQYHLPSISGRSMSSTLSMHCQFIDQNIRNGTIFHS